MSNTNTHCKGDQFLSHEGLTRMKDIAVKYKDIIFGETARIDGSPVVNIKDEMTTGNYHSEFDIDLLEDTAHFERANFGVWDNWGIMDSKSEKEAKGETKGNPPLKFRATGFSMVYHPRSPFVPSTRIHYHMFYKEDGEWWVSGGIDETPSYFDVEQIKSVHETYKKITDEYLGPEWYQRFKTYSDEYFMIPHRNAIRGSSGVFFDHFNATRVWTDHHDGNFSMDHLINFCEKMCTVVNETYNAYLDRMKDKPYTPENVEFMHYVRGRYIEYNMALDRGIRFGILTKMPMENVLLSLPPNAKWGYLWEKKYAPDSDEAKSVKLLTGPSDWLAM